MRLQFGMGHEDDGDAAVLRVERSVALDAAVLGRRVGVGVAAGGPPLAMRMRALLLHDDQVSPGGAVHAALPQRGRQRRAVRGRDHL